MPAKREISSGLSDLPVMCTTIERVDTDDCDWYSCGEWCLSKSSHCTKLWAQVRKNGTDVMFKGCSNIKDITCAVNDFFFIFSHSGPENLKQSRQKTREIDLLDFTSFFGLDFFKSSPLYF